MMVVVKKGTNQKAMKALVKKAVKKSKKHLDAGKFCGTVKFKEDGLILQKRLRDEW